MSENLPNISKDILDEYFQKIIQKSKINQETKELSDKIKYEMDKVGRKNVHMYGYSIEIETKFTPNEEFFRLMYKKELGYLITNSINTNNLKKAKKKLKIEDDLYYSRYSKEMDTKWLHVREEDNIKSSLKDYYENE